MKMKSIWWILFPTAVFVSSRSMAQSLMVVSIPVSIEQGGMLSIPDSLLISGASFGNAGQAVLGGSLVNDGGTIISSGNIIVQGPSSKRLVAGAAVIDSVETLAGTGLLLVEDSLGVNRYLKIASMVRTLPSAVVSIPSTGSLAGEASGRYVQGLLRMERSVANGSISFGNSFAVDATGQDLGVVSVIRTAGLKLSNISYGQNMMAAYQGIDRIWQVEVQNPTPVLLPITLSWLPDNDNGLFDFSQAGIWRQAGPMNAWLQAGPFAEAAGRSITVPVELSPKTRFTVSNLANPLPVTLASFTARRQGPDGLLEWVTASEVNSAWFEVESSIDGQSFTNLGKVAATSGTSQRNVYRYTDFYLARYQGEMAYYRLRLMDADGSSSYSPIIPLRLPEQPFQVSVYPNPFTHQLTLTLHKTEPVSVTIVDARGQIVGQMHGLHSGAQSLGDLLEGQPAGLYLLQLKGASLSRQISLIKQ